MAPLIEIMKKELSKRQFKKMYMKYRTDGDGWTDDYWDHFFEKRNVKRFFFTAPETPAHDRMFISQDAISAHLFFMSSDSEERLFDHPGKK
ncbi:MAG: hypothetical protein HKM98_09965 [Gammaproteobacteria bacterium]|nr:hypothetical protein [Gammaproteobacteria bacterium]